MKTFKSFLDFNPIEADDFDTLNHISYDIHGIVTYLTDILRTHDVHYVISHSSLIESLVSTIKNYETENTKNTTDNLESN